MARRTLNFQTLVPERDDFEDSNGQKHEFRAKTDFGAVDQARASRIRKDMTAAMDALAANETDEAAALRFEQATTEFVHLILPSLPVERLQALSLGQRASIVDWWNKAQEEKPAGGVPADQTKP